jgi:hypothetical protein
MLKFERLSRSKRQAGVNKILEYVENIFVFGSRAARSQDWVKKEWMDGCGG